ncbi:hypothetical protein CYMTET_50903 [Cymbomonas tetramitiformis]|uniref:Uncharacterized protein n=1 Tax=Cymbomonas tetramitiformis TaxID=36881 RepID=A0AAE0BP50_9CHLO|nr:hypothetical protein CYMTET_50903 [Cymbomonas tetramitiformis]
MAKRLLQEVLIYAVSAVFSCLVLTVGLKRIENMRENSSPAAQRKREIAARLGRPIQTNSYEEVIAMDVVNPDDLSVDFSAIGGMEKIKESLGILLAMMWTLLMGPDRLAWAIQSMEGGTCQEGDAGELLYRAVASGSTMIAAFLLERAGVNAEGGRPGSDRHVPHRGFVSQRPLLPRVLSSTREGGSGRAKTRSKGGKGKKGSQGDPLRDLQQRPGVEADMGAYLPLHVACANGHEGASTPSLSL